MKEFLIGAAALAAVGPVLAQTAPPPVAGKVHSRAELLAKVSEHFTRLDSNRDGAVTREEADAGRAMMRERVAERIKERAPERTAKAFDRLDSNNDGVISRQEFEQHREVRVERRVERLEQGARRAPRVLRMHRMGGLGGHLFDMADANKDGRVTLPEAQAAAARHFDMADANRDGQLTADERRQVRREMVIKHRSPDAS